MSGDSVIIRPAELVNPESFRRSIQHHLHFTLAEDRYTASKRDYYEALAYAVRDRLISSWIQTQRRYYDQDVKRVYYLSMEFLIGRTLTNALINVDLVASCKRGLEKIGQNLEELAEEEWDAGLGNGGLGRLAACFLDSMASLAIPGYGYGIRYEYGIFHQQIENGHQVETPDNWLRYGNPWEIGRPSELYPVHFYGHVHQYADERGAMCNEWVGSDVVMAMAYDVPVPGYQNDTVNTLRLWGAKSSRAFDLEYFNKGDYISAVEDKNRTEDISRVLYPNDNFFLGRELRLKQEYFFVSASLQDIIRRFKKKYGNFAAFPDKVAIQLNDTHPALAIPELMRILTDVEHLSWEPAWEITVATFGYTNHTLLPEALERWPVSLLGRVLPRHLQIIYEINHRFLSQVSARFPGDIDRIRRMSLIEEDDERRVRMANLAVVGSHAVNGVSILHTDLLRRELFRDFDDFYPGRFSAKTNGITPRRWLKMANPGLAALITDAIGDKWVTDLDQLEKLVPFADDPTFRRQWAVVKQQNKKHLADYFAANFGTSAGLGTIFDCQVKRIHEYKRQFLNLLHVVSLYVRIKDGDDTIAPRTVVIGGKAAPGYTTAKKIIKLINSVAQVVNRDPKVSDRLKLVFLVNYGVALAEKCIPAADLSEQISTAGTEASGTGNMKFALNGALTIGTLDGANIEIKDAVGDDNIFIFGLTADQVARLRSSGYNPWEYYQKDPLLKRTIDTVRSGIFCGDEPDVYQPLIESLFSGGDRYMVLADFASYVACQERVAHTFRDATTWVRKSIFNVARMGRFSSDRTILDYASEIWNIRPSTARQPSGQTS